MDYLSETYPRLFQLILVHLKMPDKVEEHMAKCKEFENDEDKYSLYIHGYLLAWFENQREAGKLKQVRFLGKQFLIS